MSAIVPFILLLILSCQFVSTHLTSASPIIQTPEQATILKGVAFQTQNLDQNTKKMLRVNFLSRNMEQTSLFSDGKDEKIQNNLNQITQQQFSFKINLRKNKQVRISTPQSSLQSGTDETEEQTIKTLLDNATYLHHQIDMQQVNKAKTWHYSIQRSADDTYQAENEYQYYDQKYNLSQYNQLPICVVIPTYNNVFDQRHIRNIKSIRKQNYTNYHIVVFDDASFDGTGNDILQYLQNQSGLPNQRYQVVFNDRQMKAMFNLRRAAMQFCKAEELFMIVDGDDELIGRNVFKLYSALFQGYDAWFVYTNFLHSNDNVGFSRPYPEHIIQENNYRFYPLVASHLRVFYTKLFQNLKQADLRDEQGEYYKAANDVAICVPILQQAYQKVKYIPQLTYYYNINTGQNNHILRRQQQRRNDRRIRRKNKYEPLQTLLQ